MITLSKGQILSLHHALIERYGGSHGVRDEGLLDSALNAPYQVFGEYVFFPTVIEKAVRLGYGLIQNHPFHDGNKRIGALAMLTMLKANQITLNTDSEELEQITLSVASGTVDYDNLLKWVTERIE